MNTFKERYGVHKSSFTHQRYKESTGLSSFIWKIKERNLPYRLTFSVVTLAPAYTKESKFCFLCLAEKTSILFSDHFSSLNKRSELMGKCRHRQKQLLLNWWFLKKAILTNPLLDKFGRWKLNQLWPKIFRGECIKDFECSY